MSASPTSWRLEFVLGDIDEDYSDDDDDDCDDEVDGDADDNVMKFYLVTTLCPE